MPEIVLDSVAEKLGEALEQMAFISVFPLAEAPQTPPDPILVTVEFDGPVRGHLDLLTGKALGTAMAANMLASSPEDPIVDQQAHDALRELLNVTCGGLLSDWIAQMGGTFQMQIPTTRSITPLEWQQVFADGDFSVFDADGQIAAVRLVKSNS
ncbi:MAG TPA: chemotaxis protein CheX [Tepidisphaeraceae bacterium]|nr:chemotaxis protein CheX [Tepidisphaeraceae bacterium]